MKKIFAIVAIAWLAFSSCSKDDFLEKSPTFFFFEVKYGNKEIVEYGRFLREYNLYEGPAYRWTEQNDSSMFVLWTSYAWSTANSSVVFSKNGTIILGEYTVRGNVGWTARVNPQNNRGEFFVALPRTEKLTITKTGDSEYGKYVEGTLTFDSNLTYEPGNVVRASARFRLRIS